MIRMKGKFGEEQRLLPASNKESIFSRNVIVPDQDPVDLDYAQRLSIKFNSRVSSEFKNENVESLNNAGIVMSTPKRADQSKPNEISASRLKKTRHPLLVELNDPQVWIIHVYMSVM